MSDTVMQLCPDEPLAHAMQILQQSDDEGLNRITILLAQYPNDPRLFFLKGSVLAGQQRYEEGRDAMRMAIEIAPGYELARFQLGFLELTSGLSADAVKTWGPFADLTEDAPFRLLSAGLGSLARDEFAECDRLLRLGIEANNEHPMINGDMQLILDEVADKLPMPDNNVSVPAQPASAVHQLLQQFELKDSANKTKH